MTFFFTTLLLSTLTFFHHTNEKKVEDFFPVPTSDTSAQKLKPGFYLAIDDTSNVKGYKLRHSNQYFFLGTDPTITIDQIDTITKSFYEPINRFMVNIKFNPAGAKAWLDFTKKYQGLKVAIVLNNEIIYAATIHEPIHSGVASIMARTESDVDEYKLILEKEVAMATNGKGNP